MFTVLCSHVVVAVKMLAQRLLDLGDSREHNNNGNDGNEENDNSHVIVMEKKKRIGKFPLTPINANNRYFCIGKTFALV